MQDKLLQTPDGVRDTYDVECKKKRKVMNELHHILELYSYHDIETPTFEFFDIFNRDKGSAPSNEMYKFFDRDNNTLVLRPDITPSIAKSMGKEVKEVDKDAMLEYVQKSGGQIIKRKGATFYAVSASVCKLCSILSASSDSITTVSSMMHGEYGIDDVCLSTLTLVGPNGIQGKVPMRMNKKEIEQLHKSADALKAVIAQIDLD